MKKVLVFLIATISIYPCFCQTQSLALFMGDSYGRPLFMLMDNKAEGSPYFNDDYHNAQVTIANGKVYDNIWVKVNIADNIIQYLDSTGREMITGVPVKKILFYAFPVKTGVVADILLQGIPSAINTKDAPVYQVLDAGKIMLLKKISITYQDEKKYTDAATTRTYDRKEVYYFANNSEQIKKLDKGKAAMLDLFSDKKSRVVAYIDGQNLDCKKEEDLKKVFNFYNSISQ